jgi:hypothetical protein
VVTEDLELPLTSRVDLETARMQYEKYKDQTVNIGGARAKYYEQQIRMYEEDYKEKRTRPMPQTIVRIGSVAFVSFPYEIFSEIGMRIAKDSPIPYTLSLSNTNGSEGYFVTETEICRGGYEIGMFKTSYEQPYADNADWHMIKQTIDHLNNMKEKETR